MKMHHASFPVSQLASWALLNNVELRGIKIEPDINDENGNSKGGGLLAICEHNENEPLLTVPHDVTVSKQQITDCARTDIRLRELLETAADSDLTEVGSHWHLLCML